MKYNYVPKYGIHFPNEIKDYAKDVTKVNAYKKALANYIETNVFKQIPDSAGILPRNLHSIITNALPKRVFKNLSKLATNSYKEKKNGCTEDEYYHIIVEYFEAQIANKIIDPFCQEKGYDFLYDVNFADYDIASWADYDKFSASIIYFSRK